MPNWGCWCGAGFHLPQNQTKLIIPESEKFCSPECLLGFLKEDQRNTFRGKPGFTPPLDDPYLKSPPHDVYCEKTEEWFRSGSELIFSKFLRGNGLEYRYEKFTMIIPGFRSNTHKYYTPDFYVRKPDIFCEVKGIWAMSAKSKFRLAIKHRYPVVLIPDYLIQMIRKKGNYRILR